MEAQEMTSEAVKYLISRFLTLGACVSMLIPQIFYQDLSRSDSGKVKIVEFGHGMSSLPIEPVATLANLPLFFLERNR